MSTRGSITPRRLASSIALVACAVPGLVWAHSRTGDHDASSLYTGGIAVWLPWLLLASLYALGLLQLWRRAGIGHGLPVPRVLAFTAGMLALLAATVWPLDALGEQSLAAHVAQHMTLLAIVAPLLLLGRPGPVFAHALPPPWTRGIAAIARRLLPGARQLAAATLLHAVVMWAWHSPLLTAAALESDALHWLMHISFLLAGLWFWSAIAARRKESTTGAGGALLALVTIMMQMGLIGALLVFAPRPLYAIYVDRVAALGLDALTDQQLAGLIMWVPTCVPYLVAAWVIVYARLGEAARDPGAMQRPALPASRD